jgi:GTPase SAR1 family protein
LRHQYMRQGQGFLLVYSVTDRSSFEEMQSFYNEVFRVKEDENRKTNKIPIIIVGNKADLGA